MAFDKLTKPKKGLSFWVWKMLVDINWARTWTWADQSHDDKERTTRLIDLSIIEYDFGDKQQSAVSVILGPLKLTLGWAQ